MLLLISIVAIVALALWVGNHREAISVVIGLLAAAAVPAAAIAIVPQDGRWELASMAVWFLIAYVYSLIFVVLLGVPAFFALRPFRPGHWWSVAAAGSLLGFGVSVLLHLPYAPNPEDFVTTAPLGGASALVFWMIWKQGVHKSSTCHCPMSGR